MNKELFKLYNIDYLKDFKKYTIFFEEIDESSFDIEEVLPEFALDDYYNTLEESKDEFEKYDSESRYSNTFNEFNILFERLESSNIDLLVYKSFIEIEKNESVLNTLKSFRSRNKITKKVVYEKLNNVSGRLVVKSGPKILTLPSRHRSILKSRYENGCIYSIDFSALEPRITAKLSGNDTNNDVYEDVLSLLSYTADRSVIKKAVISSIYGANYTSLQNLSENKSKELFNVINEYFNFSKILEMSKNIDDNGIRRNYFGRPIWNLKEEKENILINNYIQSTAVDVSLIYFTSLVKKTNLFVPLYVLHDALIVDISSENLNLVEEIVKKGYQDKNLGYFPLKLEKFNT